MLILMLKMYLSLKEMNIMYSTKYLLACCLCQMRKNTNGRLLQGKGSQIQINNKTIIEFGSRRI